jgi:hypothetical protein
VVFEIAIEESHPLVRDRLADRDLREPVAALAGSGPMVGPPYAAPRESRAEVVEQFGMRLAAVGDGNILKRRQRLRGRSRQGLYANGGSISEGGNSLGSDGSWYRCAALAMASESARDCLHLRCLARISFGPLGGAFAFCAKNASSSSAVNSGVDIAQPFEPIARSKV